MFRTGELESGGEISRNHHPFKNKMVPTLDGRNMTKYKKTAVIFNEVAIYFSEEEWSNLETWQKELYGNVMREIHSTLISLGYSIAYPDILCRVRKEQDSFISNKEEVRTGASFPSARTSAPYPDILLRIKQDEDATGASPKSDYSSAAENSMEPSFPFNEEMKHSVHQSNLKCNKGTSTPSTTPSTNFSSELVFNPKFSLWIKQEDDESEFAENNQPEVSLEVDHLRKRNMDVPYIADKSPIPKDFCGHFSNKENSNKKQLVNAQTKNVSANKPGNSGKVEESLLSIVLKRANTGSLCMPSYKYLNDCKKIDYTGKEACLDSKLPSCQASQTKVNLSNFRKTPSDQQAVHGIKPHRCSICEKYFKTIGILNVHMKTHSGIRPYRCNDCGKSFRDNWNLKVHQKIHTGETPYKCSICDKSFIQYATYMKHQRIHTGEKPYTCCYCDKRFTNSSNLVRHHRTHTGEKPYVCVECDKSFSYNTSLIQHKKIHSIECLENVSKNSGKK
ncbi:zinc finger 583 isoform X3 [Pelobates cultripes]|uniref:Zinc finger 583 isoform X3 n=1 Tax=Pelobates cultripes TaxID=61616 RepID=A0AAD1T9D2_PELCU|nr:zinc finger 583 isoform X3 [Pelobates cultripes]